MVSLDNHGVLSYVTPDIRGSKKKISGRVIASKSKKGMKNKYIHGVTAGQHCPISWSKTATGQKERDEIKAR